MPPFSILQIAIEIQLTSVSKLRSLRIRTSQQHCCSRRREIDDAGIGELDQGAALIFQHRVDIQSDELLRGILADEVRAVDEVCVNFDGVVGFGYETSCIAGEGREGQRTTASDSADGLWSVEDDLAGLVEIGEVCGREI